ncbi:type IV pilus twitching motility protein PilT [Candidatus Dojkabacteria bacterium]|nr:type IV pilus twitching motility protein PilT [Candidatus Dojkabacteria bacterium]
MAEPKVSPLGENVVSEISPRPASQGGDSAVPADNQDQTEQEVAGTLGNSVKTDNLKLGDLLELTVRNDASDLHISVGYPIFLRIDGKLQKLGAEIITSDRAKNLIYEVLDDQKRELYEVNKEIDFSYSFQEKARFRINAYNEKGNPAAAFRLIPTKIRAIDELFLPKILHEFTKLHQGLVLVVGPTGHGKSTTLASMLQEINVRDARHILTIEDPIEYLYTPARSLVDQRELHQDTHSWDIALRNVLRQDPDVILVGEMRDFETIAATITAAETGHLVFATLHTNSAAQSVDRIIDVFPEHQQAQIRMQLANVMESIVSQRLVPIIGGGRRAACEVMIGTAAVRNAIREQKTYQIDNIIQTSADVGMMTLERSLVDLVRDGKITLEEAQNNTTKPEEVLRLVRK